MFSRVNIVAAFLLWMEVGVSALNVGANNNASACSNLQLNRRSAIASCIGITGAALFGVQAPATAEEPDTRDLNAFNTLTFNYRRKEFGGLESSEIEEESITYADFLSKLDKGEVKFVEFYAPDGDVAYATLEKPSTEGGKIETQRIRIGEGFPIEIHDGWSSPAFAIRSVKEKGVRFILKYIYTFLIGVLHGKIKYILIYFIRYPTSLLSPDWRNTNKNHPLLNLSLVE